MIEDGEPIPAPSTLKAAMAHEFAKGAVAFIVVEAPEKKLRAVKVSITIPEDELDRIDSYTKARGLARSAFLVQAAKEVMRGRLFTRPGPAFI